MQRARETVSSLKPEEVKRFKVRNLCITVTSKRLRGGGALRTEK